MFKRLFSCLFFLLVLLAGNIPVQAQIDLPSLNVADLYKTLQPTSDLAITNNHIVGQLKYRHYLTINFDDQLSSKVFDRYLKELDPNQLYFLASDIKEFEKDRYLIDDALRSGQLEPAFTIYNRFQLRFIERLVYLIKIVEQDLGSFDFSKDEYIPANREDVPWAESKQELDEIWRLRLKNNVLSLLLADKSREDIAKTLGHRYRNQLNRALQNTSDDVFQFYMNALTLSYDPHTQYFSPRRSENFDINMSLSLEGIGAVLQSDEEYTKVLRLVPGGPADKAGQLMPGDRIVAVGQGTAGNLIDVVGWRLDEVVDKIRGPKGTLVRLEVIPADGDGHATKVFSINRDTVKLEEQAVKSDVIELEHDGSKYRFGIIDVPTFYMDFKAQHAGDPDYKSTTNDVQKLLTGLKDSKIDGVIIDLRDNGGGSLQEANSLVGLFIEKGPTVQVKGASSNLDIIKDTDPAIVYDGPMAVLVNRMSASASEIFAGAIQDYQRGIIIGEPTFGKGTVQALFPLDRGQLKTTTAKYYRVSGKSTQNLGVIPDIDYPSLYNKAEIGESILPAALPWDKIQAVPHPAYYDLEPFISRLKDAHQKRIKMSPDYFYVLERTKRLEELRARKVVSLQEKRRREEQQEAEAWLLDLENKLRAAKNLPPIDKVEEASHDMFGMLNRQIDKEDPVLVEGGQVLIDFITLFQQNVAFQ